MRRGWRSGDGELSTQVLCHIAFFAKEGALHVVQQLRGGEAAAAAKGGGSGGSSASEAASSRRTSRQKMRRRSAACRDRRRAGAPSRRCLAHARRHWKAQHDGHGRHEPRSLETAEQVAHLGLEPDVDDQISGGRKGERALVHRGGETDREVDEVTRVTVSASAGVPRTDP